MRLLVLQCKQKIRERQLPFPAEHFKKGSVLIPCGFLCHDPLAIILGYYGLRNQGREEWRQIQIMSQRDEVLFKDLFVL